MYIRSECTSHCLDMILHPSPPRPFKDKDRKGRRKFFFFFLVIILHHSIQEPENTPGPRYPTSWGPLKAPCQLRGRISRATMVIHRRSTGANGTLISSMFPSSSFPTPSFPSPTSQGDVGKLEGPALPSRAVSQVSPSLAQGNEWDLRIILWFRESWDSENHMNFWLLIWTQKSFEVSFRLAITGLPNCTDKYQRVPQPFHFCNKREVFFFVPLSF